MRILIVNKFLYPNGGSETYIFKIGEELCRKGHEVQFFGMEHEGRIVGNRANSYTADMDFHTGKIGKILYPFKILYSFEARRKIRAVLEDFVPDAVHLNNINFQITPSIIDEIRAYEKKKGGKIRILYTAHDYQWICPNHMMQIPSTGRVCDLCTRGEYRHCVENRCIHNSRVKSLLGTMEAELYKRKKTYAQVDRILCPSEFMNRMLSRSSVLAGKTVTMHNFIEPEEIQTPLDKFRENAGAGEDRMESSGNAAETKKCENTSPYVLYFGRYSLEKGVRTLLGACRELPEIDFVFAGKGELEDEVNAVPNVTNRGFLGGQALAELIRGAQFVVFPSEWYENCPFSVMEAQAGGVPVLASDLGGTPELICREAGKETGELFRGGDGDSLAQAILDLWNDPKRCRRYAANTEAWMKRFDTVETYCGKLVREYQER
ncbi:MAG: glycosyltransferase [Eubacteriales bacterium]|nr:glycosyltransferase [Eubacteriales bacterium]